MPPLAAEPFGLCHRLPPARQCGLCIPRLFVPLGLPAGETRSAGGRNQRPPKAGPSPALWNPPRGTGCTCVLLLAALGPVGSHRWHGNSIGSACSSAGASFYRQGLTLVKQLFPAADGLAPGGGNSASGALLSPVQHQADKSLPLGGRWAGASRVGGSLWDRPEGFAAIGGVCQSGRKVRWRSRLYTDLWYSRPLAPSVCPHRQTAPSRREPSSQSSVRNPCRLRHTTMIHSSFFVFY